MGTIIAHYPFERISWDIMGPLPASSKGHNSILITTDMFSKWVEAFPLQVTDSERLAKVLVDEIGCRYGVPPYLHSHQGSYFNSEVIRSLCKQIGIGQTRTTPYHPQVNSQVERFNHTLESMLSKIIRNIGMSTYLKHCFHIEPPFMNLQDFYLFLVNYECSACCLLMSCLEEYHHLRREQKKYLHMLKRLKLKQHTITFAKALRKSTKPTSLDTIKRSLV